MRINRFLATKIVQSALRSAYDVEPNIEAIKDRLHELVDMLDCAPSEPYAYSPEAKIAALVEKFGEDLCAVLDLERSRKGDR